MSSFQERVDAGGIVTANERVYRPTESDVHVARCGAWVLAGVAVGMAAVLAASVYAQVTVRHTRVSRAVDNTLAGVSPVGGLAEMLLVLPLAALGLVAATLHRRHGPIAASIAMAGGVVSMQLLYASGFARIERVMRARCWTAASLETAALVFVVAPGAVALIGAATARVAAAARYFSPVTTYRSDSSRANE